MDVCLCSSAPGLATAALLAVCFMCWPRSRGGRVVIPTSEWLVTLVLHEQTLCKLPPSPVTHLSALSQASLLHTTGNPPQPPLPGGGSPPGRSPSAAQHRRGALSTRSSQTSETVFSVTPAPLLPMPLTLA